MYQHRALCLLQRMHYWGSPPFPPLVKYELLQIRNDDDWYMCDQQQAKFDVINDWLMSEDGDAAVRQVQAGRQPMWLAGMPPLPVLDDTLRPSLSANGWCLWSRRLSRSQTTKEQPPPHSAIAHHQPTQEQQIIDPVPGRAVDSRGSR